MANILTTAEAANVLRCAVDDPNLLDLLPLVDDHIQTATGRDWTQDAEIRPQAKLAARMLLVRWHEDPGGLGNAFGPGLTAILIQLKALALALQSAGVPDEPLRLVASNISGVMAVGADLVLIFNHEMAATATLSVSVETAGGDTVASTNSLDATGKILTVNPNGDLVADSQYTLVIDAAADAFGQTLSGAITFQTA